MKKRKITLLLLLVLLFTVSTIGALAEATGVLPAPVEEGGPTTPYTWAALATISGATLATVAVVQYIKAPLDKVWKIPTRVVVYLIAFGFMVGGQAVINGLILTDLPIVAVNAILAANAAMGVYEQTFAPQHKPVIH